jgi:5-(carboxyamino)imidazole ribonucleotide synthase
LVRVGCLGGGQLGRMLALAGRPLGLSFTFLEPQPNSSAGQVGSQLEGAYDDPARLRELAEGSDLVTFEFESVPERAAAELAGRCPVFPPPKALAVAQDRLREKEIFARLGIPSAPYHPVAGPADLLPALEVVRPPARLKTRTLGYDGHGQVKVDGLESLRSAFEAVQAVPSILEQEQNFSRELSVLGVRSVRGELAFYPLTENHHEGSVLRLSVAPAPRLTATLQRRAEEICAAVMEELEYVGVMAIELFDQEGELMANEIAPRVHNSGHWTIEGAVTSQFENHLRAGLGWPLGETSARGRSVMLNILGELPPTQRVLAVPGSHLHLYGKEPRAGRKLGHVTVSPAPDWGGVLALGGLPGIRVPPAATAG